MGLWGEQAVPRLTEVVLRRGTTGELRDRVCSGLHGTVLEIGFGSGLNVASYPPAVTDALAVEPSDVAWRRAQRQLAAARVPVRRVGLDGQSLPLADGSADSALSTWTLCTIPDPAVALREVRRVLKPGGTLCFVEHGGAPHERVAQWQRRLEPVQRRTAGGCHLTRHPDELLVEAGFEIVQLETYYAPGAPKPFSWFYEGVAASTSMETSASPS